MNKPQGYYTPDGVSSTSTREILIPLAGLNTPRASDFD